MDEVEEIKAKTDIVELIGEYLPLAKAGRNFRANCPFHGEKTPSFMVSPEMQIFKCFGCGEGGDVFRFLEKMEGMDFGEAIRYLAKKTGVKLSEYKPTAGSEIRQRLIEANNLAAEFYHFLLTEHKSGKKALEYLAGRGVSSEAIEKFKLGWAPDGWRSLANYLIEKKKFSGEELVRGGLVGTKGSRSQSSGQARLKVQDIYDRFRRRVMFPLRNHRGECVGLAGRLLPGDPEEGKTGKYVNTSETEIYHKSQILYGLDVTRSEIKKSGKVVVVEGELDLISSWQAGVKNVVAIKGTAVTADQVKLIKRFCEEIVIALDSDSAGDMAARRGISMAENEGLSVKVIEIKNYKDPDEFAKDDPNGWSKASEEAIGVYDYYIDSAVDRFGTKTAEGKRKIGKELIPIWSGIKDEIVKAHYVRKLAEVLEVGEEIVWEQLKKILNVQYSISNRDAQVNDNKEETRKTRRVILEEHLLGVGLLWNPKAVIDKEFNDLWEIGWVVRIKEELEKYINEEKVVELKLFVNDLPAELKDRVSQLLLMDLSEDPDFLKKEFERTVMEIKRVEVKLKLEELAAEIAVREKKGEEVGNLQEEFARVSRNLTAML